MEADFAVIGGGLVGLSVALGLLNAGQKVVVIDGAESDPKASRGNFGLIWLQGKGVSQPRYARWSKESADLWVGFARDLSDITGVDLGLRQEGGLDLHFSDDSLEFAISENEAIQAKLGADYPFEVLGPDALRSEEPEVGPKVAGAVLHPGDGHADPLALLTALAKAVSLKGGQILAGAPVVGVAPRDGGFSLTCEDGSQVRTARVVLAAGLGAIKLGPSLGFCAPLKPERGQVLITEKMPPLLRRPSLIARQVHAGGIQIGATNEDVGMSRSVTFEGVAKLAADAVDAYPALARAQLLRAWGALRVMSPDGLPIYQESDEFPGAFMVSCHSGVTLAAVHAMRLPSWILKQADAPDLGVFGDDRFAA
ncbi:glycine/D-amino acid oxidase-like deaminating enzyme [Shimia isoporae]|uniref:Glycine/D-amino acid oxidase-like deaminating enzyme n=1 Tax=Shimia isoporae TaxID=647720 RepID=A0A4V2Q255_9RHOB|nr:FAD-binding oxidoreductase [Shimia isoporae]TCL01221.1 glycine/D-amino acid oxidase-like deaminating enzyme [Shimia isoporae]